MATSENDTEDGDVDVRRIQPYQATKEYLCPGCNGPVAVGTLHVVVVPRADPGERRHWHEPCWRNRARRRPRR